MSTLKSEHIYLRALEPEDLEYVHNIENDEDLWSLSNTQTPFSRYAIKEYLKHAHRDIFEVKQLRLVISDYNDNALGLIDLFDCDFKNKRAGIGIIISQQGNRRKGLGKEALRLLVDYSFKHLDFNQLYCNISANNKPSQELFKSMGFAVIGNKRQWNYLDGDFQDELMYQLLKE